MKTNNDASGGGEARATLKNGLELELAEYVWAFLAHMQKNGVPIQYLSIANEPDWPHTQPGYFLTAERHAALFKTVGEYLDKMAKKYPDVPRPKLVGPNTLSAPGAAKDYVPRVLQSAGQVPRRDRVARLRPARRPLGRAAEARRQPAGVGDRMVRSQEGRFAGDDQLGHGVRRRHARGLSAAARMCSWPTTGSTRRATAAKP